MKQAPPSDAPNPLRGNGSTARHAGQKPEDIVVIITHRAGKCAECGAEIFDRAMIRMQDQGPLCLDCADLGHLECLDIPRSLLRGIPNEIRTPPGQPRANGAVQAARRILGACLGE